jgi:hypothetical protein
MAPSKNESESKKSKKAEDQGSDVPEMHTPAGQNTIMAGDVIPAGPAVIANERLRKQQEAVAQRQFDLAEKRTAEEAEGSAAQLEEAADLAEALDEADDDDRELSYEASGELGDTRRVTFNSHDYFISGKSGTIPFLYPGDTVEGLADAITRSLAGVGVVVKLSGPQRKELGAGKVSMKSFTQKMKDKTIPESAMRQPYRMPTTDAVSPEQLEIMQANWAVQERANALHLNPERAHEYDLDVLEAGKVGDPEKLRRSGKSPAKAAAVVAPRQGAKRRLSETKSKK